MNLLLRIKSQISWLILPTRTFYSVNLDTIPSHSTIAIIVTIISILSRLTPMCLSSYSRQPLPSPRPAATSIGALMTTIMLAANDLKWRTWSIGLSMGIVTWSSVVVTALIRIGIAAREYTFVSADMNISLQWVSGKSVSMANSPCSYLNPNQREY